MKEREKINQKREIQATIKTQHKKIATVKEQLN